MAIPTPIAASDVVRRRLLVAIAIVFACAAFIRASQVSTQRGRDSGRLPGAGVVAGEVRAASDGLPIDGAQVQLLAPSTGTVFSTMTDERGRYRFSGLPPGQYQVVASKDGYTATYFVGPQGAQSREIQLSAGERLDGTHIRLRAAGVITGTITDRTDRPAATIQVTPMMAVLRNGERTLVAAGRPVQTDDQGRFRLFSLVPGRYYVLATKPGTSRQTDGAGYAPTFFPGTANPAQAVGFTLMPADEAVASFQLLQAPFASVRGSVASDLESRPAGLVSVRSATISKSVPLRADGSFWVAGLPPGNYVIQLRESSRPPAEGRIFRALVDINGADVTGVLLAQLHQVPIRGRIVVRAEQVEDALRAEIRVVAVPTSVVGVNATGTVRDDLSFEVRAWPGLSHIQISSIAKGWIVKRVLVAGQDITDNGLTIDRGISGIEVEVTATPPLLRGVVTGADGVPVPDAVIVVMPADQRRWLNARNVVRVRADAAGRFATPVPIGDMLAVAARPEVEKEWADPEVLRALLGLAHSFQAREGADVSLQLRVAGG